MAVSLKTLHLEQVFGNTHCWYIALCVWGGEGEGGDLGKGDGCAGWSMMHTGWVIIYIGWVMLFVGGYILIYNLPDLAWD